jgi:spermidine/putrescine transport system substrate-binding protein
MNKNMVWLKSLGIIFVWALLLPACVAPPTATPAPTPTIDNTLNIYNWGTYIDPAILAGFEEKFNAKINYTIFATSEETLAALRAGNPAGYDIIVPANHVVETLRNEKLLAKLNKANIPNEKHLDAAFANPPYNPGNRYCIPYLWGTLGIGYNLKATGREIRSLQDLFDPAFAGKVSMLDDARMSLGIILIYLGQSPNSTDPAVIDQPRDFLLERSQHIAVYAPDTGQELLAQGQVALAFEYSGDIFQVMADNPDLRYVVPEEGAIIWTDNMCIPFNAPHKDLAERFINYILEPEIGARLANYTHYASPNQAALPLINKADLNNPALYPPSDVRSRLYLVTQLDAAAEHYYQKAWTEIMRKHGK